MFKQTDIQKPYTTAEAITLDSSLPNDTRAIICTTAGTVNVVLDDGAGSTVTIIYTLTLGEILELSPDSIATGGTGVVRALY